MTTSWMTLMIENYVDFIFSCQILHNCYCQFTFKMKLFPKWSLLCLQCKMNVLTSHIYDMWKCECKYFDQINIIFFYIAPKNVNSHWCKGMWTTLSLCASENGDI
jgi:hypothetical protein